MVARRLTKPGGIVVADADTRDYSQERYDFAFIDHSQEAPPAKTVERIRLCSHQVVVWWDEVREVTSRWR
jgi:predicted O-methyltransferase YrrM